MARRDKTWLFRQYEDLWSPQLPLDGDPGWPGHGTWTHRVALNFLLPAPGDISNNHTPQSCSDLSPRGARAKPLVAERLRGVGHSLPSLCPRDGKAPPCPVTWGVGKAAGSRPGCSGVLLLPESSQLPEVTDRRCPRTGPPAAGAPGGAVSFGPWWPR